jgi:hypothetical protein
MAAKTTTPPEPRLDFWDTNEGALMLACYLEATREPGLCPLKFSWWTFRRGWEEAIWEALLGKVYSA